MTDTTKESKTESLKTNIIAWLVLAVVAIFAADNAFHFSDHLIDWILYEELPANPEMVVDQTDTLTAQEKQVIRDKITQLEKQYGAQLSVVMITSLGGQPIEEYSLALAEKWQLGRAEADDGLLIVVSKTDRMMRIEVGYGLEGVIPDAAASRIIRETMTPEFKRNEYGTGIIKGLDDISVLMGGGDIPVIEPDFVYWEDYSPLTQAAIVAAITVIGLALLDRITAFDSKYAIYVSAGSGIICGVVAFFILDSLLYVFASGVIGAILMYLIFFLELNGAKTHFWSDFKSSFGSSRGSGGSSSRRGGGGGFGGGGSSGGW
ncbi:hypothetical protein FJM67_15000 [Maribrevibacterium harenarium]|uniref:TPM domain-containing protein n=1 Tax=Maribrevibacterium harenarium TaxID=2589817 RepID=A0A501WN79_9GAMM|nr:TPM domain-containing protein [Maribrevibacterium harenarium]TPE47196.1 hypothetical protein FJM67_15000 [Maribrevibacterium harenarium]